jgi:hypothetical protein
MWLTNYLYGPTDSDQRYIPREPDTRLLDYLGLDPVSPGGSGGGYAPFALPTAPPEFKPLHEVKWKETEFDLLGARAPSWWKPMIPQDAKDAERPDVQQLMYLNSLIPYMSPEDQERAANMMYGAAADAFSFYKPERTGINIPVSKETALLSERGTTGAFPVQAEEPSEHRIGPVGPQPLQVIDEDYFRSPLRAKGMRSMLSQLREQTVGGERWKLGPSYTWLQEVVGALEEYAGPARSQQLALRGALDPIISQAQGGDQVGAAAAVAQMLASPFFSQGQLNKSHRDPSGEIRFGKPSKLFF